MTLTTLETGNEEFIKDCLFKKQKTLNGFLRVPLSSLMKKPLISVAEGRASALKKKHLALGPFIIKGTLKPLV